MAVIFLFSLGNASDAFLLLRFADVGIAAFWIPLLWSAIHVVKAISSIYGGQWSDRLGRRHVIGIGWILYAAVYAAFASTESATVLVVVFLVYGLYFGLTEGVEKAWVADLAPADGRGNAFGIYNAVIGDRRADRQPAVRVRLDARLASGRVLHRRRLRPGRDRAAILDVLPGQRDVRRSRPLEGFSSAGSSDPANPFTTMKKILVTNDDGVQLGGHPRAGRAPSRISARSPSSRRIRKRARSAMR